MVEAIASARAKGARVKMTFIGDGEVLPDLKQQVDRLGVADAVAFLPAVPYGRSLFDLVDQADLAIASPKVEDTPRAALDAMARGLPILAFDIDYFRSLAEASGAVALATWPNAQSLADALKRLDDDRSQLARMTASAVPFARENSQDKWLKQRLAWTLEAIARRASMSKST
jgi:glycosyltransferase involved in cell wall biosynthesis